MMTEQLLQPERAGWADCSLNLSKSITLWEKQFHGLEVQEFPAPGGLQVNAQGLSSKQFQTLDEYFPDPKDTQNLAHSDPGLLYAAWALVIGYHTRIQDVIFGTVPRDSLSSLQRPLARFVKSTRVSWTPDTPVYSFLHSVQAQIEAINQYSDIGLEEISELSSDAEDACKFRTVLRIRDGGEVPQSDTQNHNDELLEPLAIILECEIENGCTILAKYDETLIDKQYMSNLFAQFIHVYHQLRHAIAETAVCNIDPFCPQDLTQVQKWNKDQPPEIHQVVCGAFDEQYFLHPNALAVCSWDGELTYRQLHDLSSRLAGYLVKIGVRLGTIVPLCFNKSI
jgi:non-ribosomal peptide synthetase component F